MSESRRNSECDSTNAERARVPAADGQRGRLAAAALVLAGVPLALALLDASARDPAPCGSAPAREASAWCRNGSEALEGAARLLFGGRLDVNRATPDQLEMLPRIGPARAAAIAAERTGARFRSLDDLARVRGIGPKTLALLRPWLEVGPALESDALVADPEATLQAHGGTVSSGP